MKKSRFARWMAVLAACALLLPLTTSAQTTPFTATGWVNGVQSPGIASTNALGQVALRGLIQTARVQATDSRVTGRVLIICDGAYNADGSANMQGPCYLQVGTWDASGTNFTPTGGLWEMPWHGVMQTNFSVQISIAGYGSGGAIDGWRLAMTLTRAAAKDPIDPTVPYLYTGTIQPPPLNTSEVVDNFDDNTLTAWTWGGSGTQFPLLEDNHQFTVRGQWPGLVTHGHIDTWDWPYMAKPWSVENNQTLECRVDLLSMSENATNAAGIILSNLRGNRTYELLKGRDFIEAGKWVGGDFGGIAVLLQEQVAIKNRNVVLSLALTRVDPNMVVTVRVLDKDNQEAVLYQRSVVDTPEADPTLTSAQIFAMSGMNLTVFSDDIEPPLTSGAGIALSAWQYTDGNQPELDVTYDNLELRTSEIPPLVIERAVRVSFPESTTVNYAVQAAPTVQGPWLPVQDRIIPGLQTMTLPANSPAQFLRLIQAP